MSNSDFKTRFYNQIQLVNGEILKTSTAERIQTEYTWFEQAKQVIPQHIPLIHEPLYEDNRGSLRMEYIKGNNLYNLQRTNVPSLSYREMFAEIAAICARMRSHVSGKTPGCARILVS
jgi:hypothetical protein